VLLKVQIMIHIWLLLTDFENEAEKHIIVTYFFL